MRYRLPARLNTLGWRLGRGAALSAAVHLGGLALLATAVVRAGRAPIDGDGSEGDRIDVTAAAEAGAGLPGLPASTDDESAQEHARAAVPSEPAQRRPAHTTRPRPSQPPRLPTGAPRAVAQEAHAAAAVSATAIAVGTGADGERSAVPGVPAGPSPLDAFRAELKQKMRAAWRAREVYQKIDPEGRLEGALLITSLHVRLRADGTVEKAELRDSSGIAALDTEAMSAIHRMKPISRLPGALVDAQGGAFVRCAFHLDLGQYRFANLLRRAVAVEWRPARAFMASSNDERVTRVRLMLDRRGTLLSATVIASSGLDLLDRNALAWARPGLMLPAPPPAFHRAPGEVPVFVAFYHLAGQVHFLWPREDLEGE
jgi:TonB family protein